MAQILTEMAEMENVTKALFLQGDPFYHQIKCLVRTQDSAMGLMLEGKFLEACKTILGHVSGGLAPGLQWTDVQDRLVKWLEEQPIDRHSLLNGFAISALQLFVQINWTGLKISVKDVPEEILSFNLPTLLEDALVLDGEGLVEVVQHPELLLLSRLVLTHPEKNAHGRSWPFQWWRLRSCLILQQCLTDKSDPLHKETLDIIGHVSQDPEWLELEQSDESGKKSLATLWHLEVAHFYGAYYEVMKVKEHVDRAARFSDLSLVETGAMGRRTKFQKFDLAQLTLDIKVKANGTEAEKNGQDVIETDLPVDLKLDDDVRLDKIKFADPQNLEPVDISKLNQCVLIAYFTLKQRSQPRDELTREELMPYLNVILNNRNPCWALKSSALLFRSKLESYERRTIERCLMQVQTIVDHLNTEEHSLARTHFVYASRMPPIWDVEAQLCRLLQSLGSVKSALDIALKLHFWEDVIQCYHQLQLRHKAAEVIRQQLEKRETPLLYCMLGDATDDITHYEKALELSDNKSARAYRSLGLYFYYRQNYEKTVEYLQKSLDLNSFQMHSLLRLGYAAMQIENWAVGADAYRKYCAYESDNFEAWNNLSNAYIKLGQKSRAWKVLQEAAKCDYDNWKIWDNIMVVSTDCAYFEEVFKSYHRLLDLKEKHVDIEVLAIINRAIINNVLDSEGRGCVRFLDQGLKLLGRITSQVTNDGLVWEKYAELTEFQGQSKAEGVDESCIKSCQFLQRACSSISQKSGWEKDVERCKDVHRLGIKYAQGALKCSKLESIKVQAIQLMSSCRMSLKGILTKTKQSQTSVSTNEIVEPLKESSNELDQLIQTLTCKVAELKG